MAIGVGVIGYGKQGASHARAAVQNEGFELVAIADATPASRAQAAADHPTIRIYEDASQLMADDAVDVVVVVTPTTSHAPLAIQSMRSGKHVVCEKPMCMNSTEAAEIYAVSQETGRYFCVYQNRRGDEYFTKARAVLDAGLIGELRDFKIVRNRWGIGAMVWGSERFRPQWRSERAYGGGMLFDWGGHWIDQALLLHRSPVESVYAQLFVGSWVEGQDAEDGFRLLLRFADGVCAQIEFQAAALGSFDSGGWVLSGTRGGYAPGSLYQLADPDDPLRSEVRTTPWDETPPAFDFWAQMRSAIETQDRLLLPVPVEESLRVMRVIDAAFASHDSGRSVHFDPPV